MTQPLENKGFSETFRESVGSGFSFASSMRSLAAKFKRSSHLSDQEILAQKSGYVVVDEISGQFDFAAQKEENEKKKNAERSGFAAIFEQSSNGSGKGIFEAANDFFTMLGPMIRNPFSFNK